MKEAIQKTHRIKLFTGIMFCIFFQTAQINATESSIIKEINSTEKLMALIDSSGEKLLMFDLYADWCMPCKLLSPMLEKIAKEMKNAVTVYKINIDNNPEIAGLFQVTGIPLVVMVKNKKAVQGFMGVQPEDTYRRAIIAHGSKSTKESKDQADGKLVNGVRTITLNTSTTIGNLYVYRGEEVRIVFDKVDFVFSVSIPKLKASGSAKAGEKLVIEFKAKEAGVFTMMCNGKCPVGDGQNYAKIIVMEYEGDNSKAVYKSITPKQTSEIVTKEKPLLLDVRTPNEYYEDRIDGAKLIPVQQLEERISELDSYKDKPIIVYCRSGNRSIPASQILIQNGFKKVYNMQYGIIGWSSDNLPILKQQ
jgi:thioredoxin